MTIFQFFLSGLLLGLGICGLHCSILLLPLIARTSSDWKEGLRTGLIFGSGKVIVCALYGGVAALTGRLLNNIMGESVLSFAGGLLLAVMGIWFLFYSGKCGTFIKSGSPFLLGLIDGLIPCGPLIGFAVYIAAMGKGVLFGASAGLLYGIGTITSPLIIVCGITPYLWQKLARFRYSKIVLRILGAAVFFFWGIVLIIP